jgi:hypothetical protein
MHRARRILLLLLNALAAGCPVSNSAPDGGTDATDGGAACDLSTDIPVTKSSSPTASETWTSGVYRVTDSLLVPENVTLTIAGCTRLELSKDVTLAVHGKLVVAGSQSRPVSFVAATSGEPWGSLFVESGASADLSHTSLNGGGGSQPVASSDTLGAPLYVRSNGGLPATTPLKVDHLSVVGSTGVGVALINAGFAADSAALLVRDAGSHPVYLGAHVLDSLPEGTYTGNAVDAIALQTAFFALQSNEQAIISDTTIHNRGVPYDVGLKNEGRIVIGDSTSGTIPLVTIEPGVTLRFCKGPSAAGGLSVQGSASYQTAYGALRAVGTASQPIVFTSCAPTPKAGDWMGLRFFGVDPRTRLEHVKIDFAGADSSTQGPCVTHANAWDADAALQVFAAQAPAQFITDSELTNSAGSGISRNWRGDDVDFISTNSLSKIAWCSQTLVPGSSGTCPSSSCPSAP